MSLMASPSSLSSRNWSYNVFASFHGPDVRKTLLSHMREQFNRKGITMFNDQKIERSATIGPSLKKAIRESRISIVILSEKYASSSWCLDELVEILECKETIGQIVMTIFYGVDPSNVRKQEGDFGVAFDETCAHKTEEDKLKWSKALIDVGNIAGEDFFRWDTEAKMIEKVAKDVLDKLNATPSRDFDGMVGLEDHLKKMKSLLDLDYGGVKMVAITGPAGIGKTTIAWALHSRLSYMFQLSCFVDNLRGNYYSGFDEYGSKISLQEQFLSKILNQDGIRISHLGAIQERLRDQRVLIILDDVNNIKQLEVLANETTWFGPGSRIVVTTENKELLQQHGIIKTYEVQFPSIEQAHEILCKHAFKQSYPHNGFEKLVQRVTGLCGKLPLGLSVVGSSLRGKSEDEWKSVMHKLETKVGRDIEGVLRVGYESLEENEQRLFLHIAVFFNYKDCNLVRTMFADSDLDVKQGLKVLVNKSLIQIYAFQKIIVMHRLLKKMGKSGICKQEALNGRILMDANEICDVLENATGTRAVSGISFDIFNIEELSISARAFKKMANLRFLRVYKSREDRNDVLHIPEEMEFPRLLRLLDWDAYPSKCLPPTFHVEFLVELNLKHSKLEYLWQGTQPLTNLKKVDLKESRHLKELPDLSSATNLETLELSGCESLVEIPSTCSHLHKLQKLTVAGCINLQVIPADMNLASLEQVFMEGCTRLRNIPVMSTNIKKLCISETAVEDVPTSTKLWSRLTSLIINKTGKLKGLTRLPTSVTDLDLSYSDIVRISNCIKALHQLKNLNLTGCRRLTSLPELPRSLKELKAEDCDSLKTVFGPMNTLNARLNFINCFKLGQQARRAITLQSFFLGGVLLPGREVPAEFDHRGSGNSVTIRPDGKPYSAFLVCVVISSNQQELPGNFSALLCRRIGVAEDDFYPGEMLVYVGEVHKFRREHLFVFDSHFIEFYPIDMNREIVLEFTSKSHDFNVLDCGARILTDESIEGSYEFGLDQVLEEDTEFESSEAVEDDMVFGDHTNGIIIYEENLEREEKHTHCWSWLFHCFHLSI